MDIEEGEEVQAKGIEFIFNKIIAEILRKVQDVLKLQTDKTIKEHHHIM
jgi:hypothetical protein